MRHPISCVFASIAVVLAGACTPEPVEKATIESSAAQETESAAESITARNHQLDDRCGFDPIDSWTLIETFGGYNRYSIDPTNPVTSTPDRGQAGVFVQVSCSSTDGLGGLGFNPLPGVTLIDDSDVSFGGGDGNRLEIHFDDPAFPPALSRVAYVIRVDGTHCQIAAEGSVEAVDAAAPEIELVAASLLCVGG